ncbi:MAG TPA: endonuclease [Bacteroidia bacterium]|nr:endonuclease [Bacteroidia bacterium]
MQKPNIIEQLGFDRATSIDLNSSNLSESQLLTIEKVQDFDIDSIYFCTDNLNNSHPGVFLKKITSFDTETLKTISNTHKKIWNYKKVVFLYVYSDTEIRIYNCAEKPLIISSEKFDYQKELKKLEIKSYILSDKEKLEELNNLFSTIAIDTGIIWTIEEAELIRKKINLQRRVDKYLVESLIRTAKQLQDEGLEIDFIHKIIMRSLFLLYLEDRGATNEIFYSKIRKGAKSYFDILDNVEDTYALFEKLEDYFNGNVFTLGKGEARATKKQLQLIKKCFINGNDNTTQIQLFSDRLFNFKIIQIELLSEIYENFLSEINPELKQQTGTYYTPPSLVELILNEKLPINNKETEYNVKTLDPSCGSGIFLVESFKRLVKRYENKHNKKLTDFNKLKRLLTENIYGIEINSQSIKVTAFSLYLALVDELNPKTFWQNKNYRLPYLINDANDTTLKEQGNNLFCRDTIETNNEIESIEFDLVVGNPPFGTKNLLPSIKSYSSKYGFAKEMVLPFLHKATQFSKNGDIVLIFNTKVLTNTSGTYQKFRKWLFNDCYVEKIYNFSILRNVPKNFGGQLFGSATGPISIVFYKKEKPKNPSKTILYYAPKTFIKSNVIEGVSIDSTDVKYLPREECQKPNTKIWKIAMWGNSGDINLIKELSNTYPSLKEFFENEDIDYGVGFQSSNPKNKINDYIKNLPIHNPSNILKYYTPKPKLRVDTNKFHRLGKTEAYKTNHILLNEGVKVSNNTLTILSSYVDYSSAYSKGIVGIFSTKDDFELLKLLTIYLNSDFVKYFAFLTTSTWGIERDVVKHLELFEAPYLLFEISEIKKKNLLNKFSNILSKGFMSFNEIKTIEDEVNSLITSNLSTKNKIVINHLLDNIDLFHKKDKSKVLLPVLNIFDYTKIIKEELNNFLENQILFANATIFNLNRFSPLMMIKISFSSTKEKIKKSKENIETELKKIDEKLWEEKATNIYFRKKLNYKTDNDIYIIRPNQRRFWSESMALEDASELILEILNDI